MLPLLGAVAGLLGEFALAEAAEVLMAEGGAALLRSGTAAFAKQALAGGAAEAGAARGATASAAPAIERRQLVRSAVEFVQNVKPNPKRSASSKELVESAMHRPRDKKGRFLPLNQKPKPNAYYDPP